MSDYFDPMGSLMEFVQANDQGYLFTPVASPSDESEVSFTGFGITSAGQAFNIGWALGMDAASQAVQLQAMCSGVLSYESANKTLRLSVIDPLSITYAYMHLPDWFPVPYEILYQNIHEEETRTLLETFLTDNPDLVEALCKDDTISTDTDTYLDAFFGGYALNELPVSAGMIIGTAGTGTSSEREVFISFQESEGSIYFIDPAAICRHLEDYFYDLGSHALKEKFLSCFGPIKTNGVIRYIQTGGGSTGDFKDYTQPSATVQGAIDIAEDFDTLVILDTERYAENIVITKAITITSIKWDTVDAIDDFVSTATYEQPDMPELNGGRVTRVVIVEEVANLVCLTNLIITYGYIGPYVEHRQIESGAGLLIYKSDQCYVYNCYFYNNESTGGGPTDGHGGGIYLYGSSSLIYENLIIENQCESSGGGIFIGGYGWPVIKKNKITKNTASQGYFDVDGGGIGAGVCYPGEDGDSYSFDMDLITKAKAQRIRFIENNITENTAWDDGGGVYLSVMSKAFFYKNFIDSNIAWGYGGGVRATLGSDIIMEGDTISNNQANYYYELETNEDTGERTMKINAGGGVACRNSDLILKDVAISGNTTHGFAGGGIFFTITTDGEAGANLFLGMGSDVSVD